MKKCRFWNKRSPDESNKESQDPHSIDKPNIENTPEHKSEQTVTKTKKAVEHVDLPVLVPEESASPARAQPHFTPGQQKHKPAAPISEPMGNPVLATGKEGWPSSPIRDHTLNPQKKVEQVKDYGVINNTLDKPKSPIHDPNHSSQEKLEPGKDSKSISNKWDKPLTTVPEQKYSSSSPIKVGPQKNYGGFNDDKQDIMPSSTIQGQTHSSPRKSYGVIDEKQDKPSTVARDHGCKSPTTKVDEAKNNGPLDKKWGKTTSPVQERPEKIDESITKVQTEASRPTRPSLLGDKNRSNPRDTNGFGEFTNYSTKGLDKPSNEIVRYNEVKEPYEVGGKNWPNPRDTNGYGEYTNYSNKGMDKPSNDTVRYKQVIEPYEVGRSSDVDGKNWHDPRDTNGYGEYTNYSNKGLDKPSNDTVRNKQVIEPYEVGRSSEDGGKNWRDPRDTNGYGEYTNYSNKGLDKPSNDTVRYKQVIEPYEVGGTNWRDTDEENVYGEYANYRNKDFDRISNNTVRYKQVIERYDLGGRNRRDIDGANACGEYANYGNNGLNKSSNDIVRYEQVLEPYVVGKHGWEVPRKKEWARPPTQVTPIFGPTNDIGKVVEFLKEAVISAPPPRYNFNYPDSRDPIRDKYKGAIDSIEAQRRFGNPNPSARPNYKGTISSIDAARKYGGAPV